MLMDLSTLAAVLVTAAWMLFQYALQVRWCKDHLVILWASWRL
jgi:hypothetical protein